MVELPVFALQLAMFGTLASEWDVPLQFYGDDSKVLSGSAELPCAALKRRPRTSALSVRPAGSRVIVNAECKPTPDLVDAGDCVQMQTTGRREIACLPSLVIFGFQKCGTAELQGWLSAHPVMHRFQGNEPQKSGAGEADYFNLLEADSPKNTLKKTWRTKYLRTGFVLTKPSDATRLYTFEKSPNYGHMGPEGIAAMHSLLPSLKLIALVREPTARAYSGFQHTCMKGRIFKIRLHLGESTTSQARNLLRRELAGRIVIAENKSQAVEGLFLRFGRFAIFEVHLRRLEYPCPPSAFDNFLMIPETTPARHSSAAPPPQPQLQPHLNDEVLESLLDVRHDKHKSRQKHFEAGSEISSILTHGLYAEAIADFQALYGADQLLVLFTEELQRELLQSLEKVMAFLGVPFFDYRPFASKNSRGGVVATFQRSKTESSLTHYLPMSNNAQRALDAFYAQPNLKLAKVLGDDRTKLLWSRKPA